MKHFARIAILAAMLVGCQKKSSAPTPSAGSAGSAVGTAVHHDDTAAPSAGSAEAAGSAMGSAGSNAGSAAADDAGAPKAGSGVGSALRQEKLNRLKEKRVHGPPAEEK